MFYAKVNSCGCLKKERQKKICEDKSPDLSSKIFNFVKVIDKTYSKNGKQYWNCICTRCNTKFIAFTGQLTSNDKQSCGCLSLESRNINMQKGFDVMILDTNLSKIKSKKIYKNNSSGTKGVFYSNSHKKWCAVINFKKAAYRLGEYDDINDAIKVRKIAEEKLFTNFLEWYEKEYGE